MKLLDCGCGPGTISLGLAQAIAPGTVTGIDREASQISIAAENALKGVIANANFQQANIYELPFADESFDAVFSHALFEHLQDPAKALQEILRVLKPGGIIGLRSPDWSGFLIAPTTPELDQAMSHYKWLQQQNGGNLEVGRELRALLRQAGFINIKASASYQCYEPLSLIAEYLALQIEVSVNVPQAMEKEAYDLKLMSNALREWSEHPDGLFAQAWCEVIGQKDINS
ncbi:methyltransferase domain-containing protein [Nostoc sp. CHAB 5844]|nr:methyltransferase domain-containing protein [Nostoc sp. CHAB 5844]